MEVKMNQVLKQLDGKFIPHPDSEVLRDDNGNPLIGPTGRTMIDPNHVRKLLLSDVCVVALSGSYEDERNLSADKKIERWKLSQRIYKTDKVDLKSEEVTMLKEVIGKGWGTVVAGQACEMLDPVKE